MQEWLGRAKDFFGPALDLERVRVIASRWVLGPPRTAGTCKTGHPIPPADPSGGQLPSEATLIHELGHVWEHRAGQAQLLTGLREQIGRRFGRDPYDFGGPTGVRDVRTSRDSRRRARRKIITELWKAEHGYRTDRKNVEFFITGYVDDLRRLVRDAGIGTVDPARRTFPSAIDSAERSRDSPTSSSRGSNDGSSPARPPKREPDIKRGFDVLEAHHVDRRLALGAEFGFDARSNCPDAVEIGCRCESILEVPESGDHGGEPILLDDADWPSPSSSSSRSLIRVG